MKLPWWHALIKPTTVANGNFDVSQKNTEDAWSALTSNQQVYDIPDGTNPEPPLDASVFFNGMVYPVQYSDFLD